MGVSLDGALRREQSVCLHDHPNPSRGSPHSLHALVYGLFGRLGDDTAEAAIETLADIRMRPQHRAGPVFARMPLAELCTHGFELLIRCGLGLGERFLASPAYRAHDAKRRAAGLEWGAGSERF